MLGQMLKITIAILAFTNVAMATQSSEDLARLENAMEKNQADLVCSVDDKMISIQTQRASMDEARFSAEITVDTTLGTGEIMTDKLSTTLLLTSSASAPRMVSTPKEEETLIVNYGFKAAATQGSGEIDYLGIKIPLNNCIGVL